MIQREVRVAGPEDLPGIARIAVESFRQDYADRRNTTSTDTAFAQEWIAARMRLYPYGVYVVCVDAVSGIVGYNSWVLGGGRSGVVHSDQTAVAAGHRGQGVGLRLKQGSEHILADHLRRILDVDLSVLTCTCAASNRAMKGLLTATGYELRASLGSIYFGAEELMFCKALDQRTP